MECEPESKSDKEVVLQEHEAHKILDKKEATSPTSESKQQSSLIPPNHPAINKREALFSERSFSPQPKRHCDYPNNVPEYNHFPGIESASHIWQANLDQFPLSETGGGVDLFEQE